MTRKISTFSIIFGAVLFTAGCSSEDEEVAEVLPVDVTLSTISMFGGSDNSASVYNSLLQAFMSETDVTIIDNSEIATNEWREKIINNMAINQSIPDVMFFFTGSDAKDMILNNQVVSVEEIKKSYPDYASNIRNSAMTSMKEFDSKHYAVPVKGFWEGLYCNTDVFLKYNLPLPTDWSSFISAVRKFNNNRITPIAVSMNEAPNYWLEHIILSSGGATAHQLNPYTYVPETWVDGLQRLIDMYAIKSFSADAFENTSASALQSFIDKESAMLLEGSWIVDSLDSETTVVLPIPTFNTSFDEPNTDIISGFSSGFYISRQAWDDPNKRDSAVQFVQYMTSDSSITKFCENGGISPSSATASSSLSPLDTSIDTLRTEAVNSLMPIDYNVDSVAWNYLVDSIPDLLNEEITPTEVLTEFSMLNKW